MIDWILAEKIAGYVAGHLHARPPRADLTALAIESERRVTAYTGLSRPARYPRRRGSAGASGCRPTSARCAN